MAYDYQTKEQRLEVLLSTLQAEVERGTATGEQRRRRRALLRGFRAAFWTALSRSSEAEVETLLREELGLPPMPMPSVAKRRRTVPTPAHQPRMKEDDRQARRRNEKTDSKPGTVLPAEQAAAAGEGCAAQPEEGTEATAW